MQWICSLLLRCSFYHSIKSNGKSRHSYIWLAEGAISCPEISTCKLWKRKQNRRGKMFGNGNVIWNSLKSDDGAIAILTTSCGSVFVVSPSYKRLVNLRDEWVSEWAMVTLEFRSWPYVDPMFPSATYCLFRTISVVRYAHSRHIWVLTFCDLWVMSNNILCYHPCCGYCLSL